MTLVVPCRSSAQAANNRSAPLVMTALLLSAIALTSCGTGAPDAEPVRDDDAASTSPVPAAKSGADEPRHDLGPLTDRFAVLGTPESAVWYSGTLGDGRAPGPSSYWIDAIVQLSPESAETLISRYELAEAADRPELVPALEEELPTGPLLSGNAMDEAFSTGGFVSRAWLDAEEDVLVLSAVGEGD